MGLKYNYKHGDSCGKNKLYDLWCEIKKRCDNKNYKHYYLYGGRGIKMFALWRNSYPLFKAYILDTLGERPEGYTLDRINNDGNYEPKNLRWADGFTQASNRRKQVSNTSGYIGVHYVHKLDKWQARISVKNKRYNLGFFKGKDMAAIARNKYITDNNLPHKKQIIK